MVYLDYSATTPVNDDVLDSYVKACKNYIGNPNSLHKLGFEANKIIEEATKQIANLLHVKEDEIIYTSGASESNNTAIKGIAEKYKNRGKHIITTDLEHSSIYGPISYLQSQGFEIDFVKLDKNGLVDIKDLKSLIRDDTILISISAVNSETGLRQPVEEIGKFLSNYQKCFFHVDATQCIGKDKIDLENIDLISFSAHKFFGMKGVGILIKKTGINLEPLIHGGKSTTKYRSGTPFLPLIVSTSKALRIALENFDEKYNYVTNLNKYLTEKLNTINGVTINSNNYCIPQIVNFSVLNIKPETMLHALEEYEIYISTQSACSSNNSKSRAVYALTKSDDLSNHSLRVSISYITTKDEIDKFVDGLKCCIEKLNLK